MSGRVSGPRKRLPRNWDNRNGILPLARHFTQATRAGWLDIGPWAPDAGQARKTLHRLWPNEEIPGEAAQLLSLPRHFGELAQLVPADAMSALAGPDPAVHVARIGAYVDAGFDDVYIGQVGGEHEGFFEFYANTVLPRLRDS